MTKGKDYYRDNIITNCPVDVVAASNTAMLEYPLRLGHVSESSSGIASRSRRYIMDSKIGDDSVSNTDVIERAKDTDAEWVVPCDVIGDVRTTVERTVEMFRLRDRYDDYDPEIVVPLQSSDRYSRKDHFDLIATELADIGVDITETPVAIGGVKHDGPYSQVAVAMSVRDHVGDDIFLHLFGGGCNEEWIVTIREFPNLIDSLDMTSIVEEVVNAGRIFDHQMNRVQYPSPRGSNSTVISTMIREHQLYLLNYLMGPDIRDEDAPDRTLLDPEMTTLLDAYRDGAVVEGTVVAD